MWKPKEVVPEHRWRAVFLWASLLVAISAYTIWQAWNMYDGFKNPSTSLEVTNETYEFPYVLVCFFQGNGCGWEDLSTDECVSDALVWSSVLDHNYEEREGIVVESMWSNCVGFDLPKLNLVGDGVAPDEAQCQIDMEWTVTDIASEEVDYYDSMYIYVSDSEPTENNLTFLSVPYSRYVPNDDPILSLTLTELTIGKTTKENLDGEITTTYPPLILSTSVLASENTWETQLDDNAYGQLNIHLTQGLFSRTSVKELSPLDLGGFFGNVGGFWELLIVLWGLFFIANSQEDAPKLKAREFVQPVKEIIRRRSLSVDSGTTRSTSTAEERPHWESAYAGSNRTSNAHAPPPRGGGGSVTMAGGTAAAAGFPVIAPVNGGSGGGHHRRESNGSATSSMASSRRPVVQDAPRRGSFSRAVVPPSEDPAPPAPPSYFDMTRAV